MSKIGAHVSIAGGIFNAPKNAADLGCEVFQIFTRSPRGGPAAKITKDIAELFKSEMKKNGQENCYIHTPYYINFASGKIAMRKASVKIVREELERGSLIGAKYIMTHLGSFKDLGEKEALNMTRDGAKEVLKGYKGSTYFLLEISAGSGSVIGDTFEELKYIRNGNKNIGICLDTAHLFASGYDIKTQKAVNELVKKIKETVGLDSIKLIHANDSKVGLGERRDRHEHIGMGKIGEEPFGYLMKAFPNCDFILETEHDKVKEDLISLKRIRKGIR